MRPALQFRRAERPSLWMAILFALLVILLTLLAARRLGALPLPGESVLSDFAAGTEEWTVRGPAQGPNWEPHEGNPPACISAFAMEAGAVWYWRAPAKFLGERSRFYGRALSYDTRQPGMGAENGEALVILEGAGMRLEYRGYAGAHMYWATQAVPLAEGTGWEKSAGRVRAPVTRAEFLRVLGGLTALEIRGGGASSGGGPLYLDNVGLNAPRWVMAGYGASLLAVALGLIGVAWTARRRGA